MNIFSHEFDPDFDKGNSGKQESRLSLFDALSLVKPEIAFWSGVVVSLFAVGTIGFLVLLSMVIKNS